MRITVTAIALTAFMSNPEFILPKALGSKLAVTQLANCASCLESERLTTDTLEGGPRHFWNHLGQSSSQDPLLHDSLGNSVRLTGRGMEPSI